MKKRKILLSLAVCIGIILSSVITVNALERGTNCSSNTVTSDSKCITDLVSNFSETGKGEDIFKLSYKFEVTGLSGGVGVGF